MPSIMQRSGGWCGFRSEGCSRARRLSRDLRRESIAPLPTSSDRLLGSLTLDGTAARHRGGAARLRWFILIEEAHGRGIGKTLMQMAMNFLAETRCRSCSLTTFSGLDPARQLYERHGFRLIHEALDATWDRPLLEQRFEWRADAVPAT